MCGCGCDEQNQLDKTWRRLYERPNLYDVVVAVEGVTQAVEAVHEELVEMRRLMQSREMDHE